MLGLNDPWLFQEAIVRDNIVRKVDGKVDGNSESTVALGTDSCLNVVMEGNIFGTLNGSPQTDAFKRNSELRYSNSVHVKSLNNQYMSGQLKQAFNDSRYVGNGAGLKDELETEAEFWLFSM